MYHGRFVKFFRSLVSFAGLFFSIGNSASAVRLLNALPVLSLALASASLAQDSDPAGALGHLAVARFAGIGAESIHAMASDAEGNLYIAGATTSPDFPVHNAHQPSIAEPVLRRSTDRGATWQAFGVPPVSPVRLMPHPTDGQTLLMGGNDGIYRTSDGGQTWHKVYASPIALGGLSNLCCLNLAFDPANPERVYALVAARDSSSDPVFLASEDGGERWESHATPVSTADISGTPWQLWVDPHGSGTVWVGRYRSTDGGRTWAEAAHAPAPLIFIVPDPWQAGRLVGASSVGSLGALYVSRDWGATWAELRQLGSAARRILFDPDIRDRLYAFTYRGIEVSEDGGSNWRNLPAGDLAERGRRSAVLSRRCDGGVLLTPGGSRVLRSPDFGTSWEPTEIREAIDLAAGAGCTAWAAASGEGDAFVAKLGPDGELIWSTFLGGQGVDSASEITVDEGGNVYVGGSTRATDFPATAGPAGGGGFSVFVAKFDRDGRRIYSTVIGDQAVDTLISLAAHSDGGVYVGGVTTSPSFPVTPGAYAREPGRADGFAVRLDEQGNVRFSTYLPNIPKVYDGTGTTVPAAVPVLAEADGSLLIGAKDGVIYRLDPEGGRLDPVGRAPGPVLVFRRDSNGYVYAGGQTIGGTSARCPGLGIPPRTTPDLVPGDVYVDKLEPDTLKVVYSARLAGSCQSWPRTLAVGEGGEVTIGLYAYGDFPLRNPLTVVGGGGGRIARLSADGSRMVFATVAPSRVPPVALAEDGSIYTSVTGAHTAVVKLPVVTEGPVVERAGNAFDGALWGITPGMVMGITGESLTEDWIDLGLNHGAELPTQLGDLQVLIGGVPAPLISVSPHRITCLAPASMGAPGTYTDIRIVRGGVAGWPIVTRVASPRTAFLTKVYPEWPTLVEVDGLIRNRNGTVNSRENPAGRGEVVTLYATALEGPGPVRVYWNSPPQQRFETIGYLHGEASRMPGFVEGMYQVEFRIPDASGPGVQVPVPDGVRRSLIGEYGWSVGVWVR